MGTHCGTHVDAPLHMLPDGQPLECFSLECFIGPCRVLTVPYPVISEKTLEELNVKPGERILLRTDPTGKYNKHARFNPAVLSMRAAQYLAQLPSSWWVLMRRPWKTWNSATAKFTPHCFGQAFHCLKGCVWKKRIRRITCSARSRFV